MKQLIYTALLLIGLSACVKSNPEVERTFHGQFIDTAKKPIANTSMVLTHVIIKTAINDKKREYKNYSFATDQNGNFSVKASCKSDATFKIYYPDEAKGDYDAFPLWYDVIDKETDIEIGTKEIRRK